MDMLDVRMCRGRRLHVEDAHALPPVAERFYEMMSDEAAATGNQDESHEEGLLFRFWKLSG
jgi:hypothetical protein